jgi:metal-responsive CopG/Arc/MetJ family transcriptional regulator
MGRYKKTLEDKKKTISISLDEQVFNDLDSLQVKSKSQLINWLLREHFNQMGGQYGK